MFSVKRWRLTWRIGQLTMQLTWSPAILCHIGGLLWTAAELDGFELNGVELRGVERYSGNCVQYTHTLTSLDNGL